MNITAVTPAQMVHAAEFGDWQRWCQRCARAQLGQLLYNLDRSSLSVIRAVVENLSPCAWDPVMTTVLACWAFLGLMGLGTLIMTLFDERTQYQYQSLSAPTASSRSLRNRYPGSRTRRIQTWV